MFESLSVDIFTIFRFDSLVAVVDILHKIPVTALHIRLVVAADVPDDLLHEGLVGQGAAGAPGAGRGDRRGVEGGVVEDGDRGAGGEGGVVPLGGRARHVHLHHQPSGFSEEQRDNVNHQCILLSIATLIQIIGSNFLGFPVDLSFLKESVFEDRWSECHVL